ncbi:MAG: arginyltransferase [Alphaproteobacteria bacterium]|nr:arginyltransferase [Alphaproteobacteria bacterium]
MTEQFNPRIPQFYLTQPAPCPYLPGKQERKVFTRLAGDQACTLNDTLTHAGFRRSQNIAYRPACEGCSACVSVRILVDAFEPSKNQRRVIARNSDLAVSVVDPWATEEQYLLLRQYLDLRHKGGGMSEMNMFDFVAMVEDSSVKTHLAEYRVATAGGEPGVLKAAALTDVLGDGLSMVYSFFDTAAEDRSLGTFMVLDHIEQARARGLPYVYLGYLVEGCRKMSYKARFAPLEALTSDGWRPLKER